MRETNVTEWIWSEELKELLSLCGESEKAIGANASDYDRFEAFFRCFPMLIGNRTAQGIAWHLEHTLGIREPISVQDYHRIWHLGADALLEHPTPKPNWKEPIPTTPVDVAALASVLSSAPTYLAEASGDASRLTETDSTSFASWQSEIKTFMQGQKGHVFFTLPSSYRFCAPDPYHVREALQNREKGEDLLLSQLMRDLAIGCQEGDQTLVLRVESDAREAVKLLEYTEARVGLPSLVLQPICLADVHFFRSLIAKSQGKTRRFAVCPADFATTEDFHFFLSQYAARYPIGALCVVKKKEAD